MTRVTHVTRDTNVTSAADHFPPRPLSGLGAAVAGIPCESPHIVVANLLSIRPVEMTGWRETLR